MGHSARPGRRKAAPASYGGAPKKQGRTRGGKAGAGRRGGWDRESRVGCLFMAALLVGIVAFAVAVAEWGAALWADVAPGWPGGGYGFAVTAGALLPVSATATGIALFRVSRRTPKARSAAFAAAALASGSVTLVTVIVAFAALPPKRRRRIGCYGPGEPCSVNLDHPYVWAVGLASTAVTIALLVLLHRLLDRRRKDGEKEPVPAG
ncbi:hypothetical protein [Streptomyces sp. NPDC048639]|uniref:hypothetical protein n=1 Tax=Streptomyces sp. NPDC048639 TaxID=3365581 RepID=UPI003716F871